MARRKLLAAMAVALGSGPILSGCGFEPVYARGAASKSVEGFDTVWVERIPDRSGQILRTMLTDRLHPRGRPDTALYLLSVDINESEADLGVALELDAIVTRGRLNLTGTYRLTDRANSVSVKSGVVRATASFNQVESEFATLTARRDARAQALSDIADQITTRLAVFFTNPLPPREAAPPPPANPTGTIEPGALPRSVTDPGTLLPPPVIR